MCIQIRILGDPGSARYTANNMTASHRTGRRRMTRDESREQTRQRLLSAAARVIARKGFGATTVGDVATRAGYTRGAFYSNFRSRDELLLELLRQEHAAMQAELASVFAGAGSGGEPLEQRLLDFYSQLYRDNDSFLLWTEAKLLAVRNKRFRAGLTALLREDRARIAAFVAAYRSASGITTSSTPPELAIACMVMVDGMRFLHLTDPAEVGDAVAERVLSTFFEKMVLGRAAES